MGGKCKFCFMKKRPNLHRLYDVLRGNTEVCTFLQGQLSNRTIVYSVICKALCDGNRKLERTVHCKKSYRFSRPQPGCDEPNSPWPVIFKLFRESLVNDIPAGDRKIANLFYSGTEIPRPSLQETQRRDKELREEP
jgi:hypothetical protein